MALSGMRALRIKAREGRWIMPLANEIAKICLRLCAAGSAG